MTRKARQIIAVLLTAFLLNALCWSVSADAFADWISSEESSTSQESGAAKKAQASGEHSQKTEKNCNEGCHACCHFHGLNVIEFHFSPPASSEAIRQGVKITLGVAPRQPRHPPRTSLLV